MRSVSKSNPLAVIKACLASIGEVAAKPPGYLLHIVLIRRSELKSPPTISFEEALSAVSSDPLAADDEDDPFHFFLDLPSLLAFFKIRRRDLPLGPRPVPAKRSANGF